MTTQQSKIQNPKSKIAVIGAGTMGSGIALVALRAGYAVTLYDVAQPYLEKGKDYIVQQLTRKGQEAALKNLTVALTLEDVAGADVVIEAALEDLPLKQKLFAQLDKLCPPPAILASNTSTLSITAIAAATQSPQRVGGMHYFNPAAVLPLVEVAQGAQTAPETVEALVNLATAFGKTPVVTRDTPGFIVNRVARPFYGEALRLVGEQIATLEQVDLAVARGGGFKMGPFRLMDLIGIDINFAAMQSVYQQTYFDPRYRPHWLQEQKVQQNALGRKTGQGFYSYPPDQPIPDLPSAPVATAMSGEVVFSEGSWGPGLAELCQSAGLTVTASPSAESIAGIVAAGRKEKLKKQLKRLDKDLSPSVPIFCQAVDTTAFEMAGWLKHPHRLIGFDGLFLASGKVATLIPSPVLEPEISAQAEAFFTALGRLPLWIGDGPAQIVPRIVCMLANEAAFAVGEGVAGADTIDLAMKLGVNYPQGPLAWAKQLGYSRVLTVIEHLQAEYAEDRYRPAPLLRQLARLERVSR